MKNSFVLGEAVRNKVTGQKMYVYVVWNPKVSCVYFDAKRETLVKVEVSPEDLEKVDKLLFRRK
ncbi:hypothetical protein [Leptospira noguchii]|uniref:PF09926 repeat protein n=1 Tax=Leptospira noguchii TaxID=28182 RepID=M6VEV5_9LEPT|nr:hypothetical protein [Leptospira noguchii]EMO51669.1 hypothetical protein LEP1GSC172_0016 [Leptospira noguchii]